MQHAFTLRLGVSKLLRESLLTGWIQLGARLLPKLAAVAITMHGTDDAMVIVKLIPSTTNRIREVVRRLVDTALKCPDKARFMMVVQNACRADLLHETVGWSGTGES